MAFNDVLSDFGRGLMQTNTWQGGIAQGLNNFDERKKKAGLAQALQGMSGSIPENLKPYMQSLVDAGMTDQAFQFGGQALMKKMEMDGKSQDAFPGTGFDSTSANILVRGQKDDALRGSAAYYLAYQNETKPRVIQDASGRSVLYTPPPPQGILPPIYPGQQQPQAAPAQTGPAATPSYLAPRQPQNTAQPPAVAGGVAPISGIGNVPDRPEIFQAMEKSADSARAAATGLKALREASTALEGGGYFGAGADYQLGLSKAGALLPYGAGKLLGITDQEKISNTETFRSSIAPQVAAVMKATVGATQISDGDRKFAAQAAGGDINLDSKSIARLIRIMEQGANIIIQQHNQKLNSVYPEGGGYDRQRVILGVDAPNPTPGVKADPLANVATPSIAAPKTQGGPPLVTTKAQFDALPKGAPYMEDDGKVYYKP